MWNVGEFGLGTLCLDPHGLKHETHLTLNPSLHLACRQKHPKDPQQPFVILKPASPSNPEAPNSIGLLLEKRSGVAPNA